jgi:arginine-tRNA-protein transferase
MKYLSWNEKTITDFSDKAVSEMYENGYVFTRLGHGIMQQTRSLRIDLSKFEQTSENRRILKKVAGLEIEPVELPLKDYDYSIGKIAKDFYENKFGPGIMSAQKIKEMLTDGAKSNFNRLLRFSFVDVGHRQGFVISYLSPILLHYSYPFYDLATASKDAGLAMMITTIQYAKDNGLKYIYLGSLQRPTDVYKLQFKGLEWFDGDNQTWSTDLTKAKEILAILIQS